MKSLRIHHNERIKENRKDYYFRRNDKKQLGKLLHTPCLCSCHMCGNPRKFTNEITLKEKISDLNFKEFKLNI